MAKMNFTDRGIAALTPKTKQLDYFADDLSGFSIRVTPLGVKTWSYVYRYKGIQRRLKLGRYPAVPLAEARRRAEVARGQLAHDVDPSAVNDANRGSITMRALATVFIEKQQRDGKRKWKENQRMLEKDILSQWGARKIVSITRREIYIHLEQIARRGSRGVIADRCRSLLRTMFSLAVERGDLSNNPCSEIKPFTKRRRRERTLSDTEIKTLWLALNDKPVLHADILRVQLLTAQRVGEVMSMEWSSVDLETGWWTISAHRAKNGYQHLVPLSKGVLEILARRKQEAIGPWVFPAPRDVTKHILLPTLQRTVMSLRETVSFSSHNLRHTCATAFASAQIYPSVISRILNHREKGVTAGYIHWGYDSEARTTLDHWWRHVSTVVSDSEKPTRVVAISTRKLGKQVSFGNIQAAPLGQKRRIAGGVP